MRTRSYDIERLLWYWTTRHNFLDGFVLKALIEGLP